MQDWDRVDYERDVPIGLADDIPRGDNIRENEESVELNSKYVIGQTHVFLPL